MFILGFCYFVFDVDMINFDNTDIIIVLVQAVIQDTID